MNRHTTESSKSRYTFSGIGSSISTVLGLMSAQLFFPFFRYGFGERYINLSRSKWYTVLFVSIAMLIYWAEFRLGDGHFNLQSYVAEVEASQAEKDMLDMVNRMQGRKSTDLHMDTGDTLDRDAEEDPMSAAEKKLSKKKTAFLMKYISWYIFFIAYIIVMIWHHRQFKKRCSTSNFDYTRKSDFDGYSWPFMLKITVLLRKGILVARYYCEYTFLYFERVFKYLLSRDSNKIFPLYRPSVLDLDRYFQQSFLTFSKVLTCYVEPGLIIAFGLLQFFLCQSFAFLCLFWGITRMFWAHHNVKADRHVTLNKIDQLISMIDEKENRDHVKNNLEKNDFRFSDPVPSEAEILENLRPHFNYQKERFVVT